MFPPTCPMLSMPIFLAAAESKISSTTCAHQNTPCYRQLEAACKPPTHGFKQSTNSTHTHTNTHTLTKHQNTPCYRQMEAAWNQATHNFKQPTILQAHTRAHQTPKHTVLQAIGSCFQTTNKIYTHTLTKHQNTPCYGNWKLHANHLHTISSSQQFYKHTHTRSPNTKTHRVTGNWKLLENNLHTVFCYQAFFTPTPTNTYKNSSASVCDWLLLYGAANSYKHWHCCIYNQESMQQVCAFQRASASIPLLA